jgi:tetratricopeptide (TPR) repeat protein
MQKLAKIYEQKLVNIDRAIEIYTNITNIEPNYIKAHLALGDLFLKKRNFKEAIDSFKEALKLKPKDLTIWKNIIKLYIENDNH